MSKKIISIIVMILLVTSSVYANERINCNVGNDGTVTIEQTLPSKKQEKVSLIVFRPGKAFEDLETQDAMNTVAESMQTTSDENGVYKFIFKIDGESGFYMAQIASESDTQSMCSQFLYSDVNKAKDVIALLNSAENKDAFYDLIFGESSGYMDLGFFVSMPQEADKRKVTDLLFDYTRKNPFQTPEISMELYKKIYCIELLNENKFDGLLDFEKYLGINKEACVDFYNQQYIDNSVKIQIMKDLCSRNLKTPEEFSSAFLEQVVLKTVAYADGYGRIQEILEKFSEQTGISTVSLTSDNYKAVLKKTYANYAALAAALLNGGNRGGYTARGSSGDSSHGKNAINGSIGISSDLIDNPAAISVPIEIFSDIESVPWAKESIEYLAQNDIISGKSDKEFCPRDLITRAEFAKIIVAAFGINKIGENVFVDVDDDKWYASYIKCAYSAGIISGINETEFAPENNITRQDMCVMIQRAAKLSGGADSAFSDDKNISEYAKEAVYALKANDIVSGFEDNSFRPGNFASRAEAAVMIYRLITK